MIISIIVAKSKNHVIGIDNQLPWHLPADLQYFKSLTVDNPIVMGRKTYESIGRPLPKRTNIVITRNTAFQVDNVVVTHGIDEAIAYCKKQEFEEVFIIGGDTIYRQTMDIADRLYITQVDVIKDNGTAFFPVIDTKKWTLVSTTKREKDEKNEFDIIFEVYEKRKTAS
jgi:dihydrofolate reductase